MATNLSIGAGAANAAYTTYIEKYQDLYQYFPGMFSVYTETVPIGTKKLDYNFIANLPVMRKWQGARHEKTLRHYNQTHTIETWEATLRMKRLDVTADNIGMVGRALENFLRTNVSVYDDAVTQEYDKSSGAGPTGYDGVALFSASHAHVPNTSNLAAATNLSHANLVTAEQTMALLQFENTEPAGITPNAMRVGPKLKRRAMQLLEAKNRVVIVDNDGNLDSPGTDDVVGITSSANTWEGDYTLYVDNRVTGFYWDLLDLTKPGIRPMLLLEHRRPEPFVFDKMTDPERIKNDDFLYTLDGDFVAAPGHWMCAYRGTGTA